MKGKTTTPLSSILKRRDEKMKTAGKAGLQRTGFVQRSFNLLLLLVAVLSFSNRAMATPGSIMGTQTLCQGSTTTLSNVTPGGTWYSSMGSVATIGVSSGIVSAIAAGTTTITYTESGMTVTAVVTVNAQPAAITGTTKACPGTSTTLADATMGGAWSISNMNATIGSADGIVTGTTAGTSVVTYTGANTCIKTTIITINPTPAAISGTLTACVGSTATLSDATAGGTAWTSSNTAKATVNASSGVVTGVATGTSLITYTVVTGCLITAEFTVTAQPASMSGTLRICKNATSTLSDADMGGTWTTANTTIATIGSSSGILTGVAAGTTRVTYTKSAGCFVTSIATIDVLPNDITGTGITCVGTSSALGDVGVGTWTSSDAMIATVGTSGMVTGTGVGTANITFTITASGCAAIKTVTVGTLSAGTITGTATVCSGAATTLADMAAGGVWSSSATATATVGSATGIVTGVGAGTSTISYTVTNSCGTVRTTQVVTVSGMPAAGTITGAHVVCVASAITLANATMGGVWSSDNTANATIGSASGIVSGIMAGTAGITYTVTNLCGTATAAYTMTVSSTVDAGTITGTASVCRLAATTLSNMAAGGVWTSGSTAIATVGSASGIVTGVAAGNATITYTVTNSCGTASTTQAVTVNPLATVAAIAGATNLTEGTVTTLTDATASGVWESSNTANATIGSATGILTGVMAGTTLVSYTVTNTCGTATATKTVTVNAASITGTKTVCVGATTTLGNMTAGGAWTSSNTSIANVGGVSGVVIGAAAGTATITYTVSGLNITTVVTVNAAPAAITGTFKACPSTTTTLADVTMGGEWTSGSTMVATVGSADGIVAGVMAGTATIIYTNGLGCAKSAVVTINPIPAAIGGTLSACVGATAVVTDATTGGVSWMSSNTMVATVGSTSGIVTGVGVGTATITYTVNTGCTITTEFSVNALPAAISGTFTACAGAATTLASTGGGTWTSANTTVATVGSASGIVTGVAAGTSTITYSVGAGCTRVQVVTINPVPSAILGTASVCLGGTTVLGSAGAGTWESSDMMVATVGSTGLVTSVGVGNATISFTFATGCRATKIVTVTASVDAGSVTGTATVCAGAVTTFSDAAMGGVWSSFNTTVATVGSASGIITGVAAGTATISYTVTTGCGSASATRIVTVNASANAGTITGASAICEGATTGLSNIGGGVWSSSDGAIATVGTGTGVVTGVLAGNVTISYSVTNGCGTAVATKAMTVNIAPDAGTISGMTTVAAGSAITLSDAAMGGAWSSGNTGVATVGSASGIVTGVSAGVVMISYTVTNGCGTVRATYSVSVTGSAIGGTATVCLGATTTLTAGGGGVWTSANTTNARIGSSSGIVTGLTSGTATISYALAGTYVTTVVTVTALPAAITGTGLVCPAATTTLADATMGGAWSSNDDAIATIGTGSGIVTGVMAGTVAMTYTATTGCVITKVVTVNPLPVAISGTLTTCAGGTSTLTDATAGGLSWTSSTTAKATVNATSGVVTGVATGTSTITYTLGTGCIATAVFTVSSAAAAITGTLSACKNATTTLSNTGGGTWSSATTAVATVGTDGVVTGVNAGTSRITYSLSASCIATSVVTIGVLPVNIAGTLTTCEGTNTTLSEVGLGTWASSVMANATVGTTGIVTGVLAGTSVITYTNSGGCYTTSVVTVTTLPAAVTGTAVLCTGGATTTLADMTAGGTWSSANNGIATIGSASGIVTSLSSTGTVNMTYSIGGGGCRAVKAVTINALPSAITGSLTVCAGSAVTLSTSTGGVWSSSNMTNATVGSISVVSGRVAGLVAGTTTISYTLANTCARAVVVTINALPNAGTISSMTTFNINNTSMPTTTQLSSDGDGGGVWSSSNTAVAIVGSSTGLVDATGLMAGIANITYTATLSGCTARATHTVNVTAARAGGNNATATEAAATTEIAVYPNPTKGTLTITTEAAGAFTIYAIDGKQIADFVLVKGANTVTLPSGIAAGVYLCRYNGTDGNDAVVRLVFEQ